MARSILNGRGEALVSDAAEAIGAAVDDAAPLDELDEVGCTPSPAEPPSSPLMTLSELKERDESENCG